MSMRKTTLAPGQLLRSVHMDKSYLCEAGSRCCTTGNPPLEVAPGQRKIHVNSYRRQTAHQGKVDTGVSELPWGNELSRDHVNRPLDRLFIHSVHLEIPFNSLIQMVSCAEILCCSLLECISYFSCELVRVFRIFQFILVCQGSVSLGLIYTCLFNGCGVYCINKVGSMI